MNAAIRDCLSERARTSKVNNEEAKGTSQVLFDPSIIHQHLDLLGEDRTSRIVDAFTETTPPILSALRNDFKNQSFAQIADHSHSLKSAANNVGLTKVAELARRLEEVALDPDKTATLDMLENLESIYATSSSLLKEAWSKARSQEG